MKQYMFILKQKIGPLFLDLRYALNRVTEISEGIQSTGRRTRGIDGERAQISFNLCDVHSECEDP